MRERRKSMTDIRKPFLKSFTVKELMQFVDYYIEHKEVFHVPGHPWEVCDLLVRFLGFGYSKLWSPEETSILIENFPRLGPQKTSELLLLRTAFDCKEKADTMGLHTNVRQYHRGDGWSSSEIEILSKYYPSISAKVMALLPGRTESACVSMAQKVGISAPNAESWSEEEIEILKTHYPEMGIQVRTFLPGRSALSIQSMARKAEISAPVRKWTDEEDRILRAQYPQMGPSVASLFHGRRSEEACHQRALSLWILPSIKEIRWSESELSILKEHYPQMGRKVCELLPGRAERACTQMAAKLGLTASKKTFTRGKKWSEEEIKILKESYPKLGSAVHKLLPNRSDAACAAMAYKLGIPPVRPRKCVKWTADEIGILKSNYCKLGKAVVDLLPGRTVSTCQKKASDLGLTDQNAFWSDEEDAVMRAYYPKEGYGVLQRLPGRNEASCLQRALKLGLCRLKATDSVSDAEPQPVHEISSAENDPRQEDRIEEDPQNSEECASMAGKISQLAQEEDPAQEETATMQFKIMQM